MFCSKVHYFYLSFQMAVQEKSTATLRANLTQFIGELIKKCQEKLKLEESIDLQHKFSQEILDEYDKAILRLHEVLLLFSCQVPKDVADAFKHICRVKNVPAVAAGGRMRKFFVNSENKVLRKICEPLREEAVCRLYDYEEGEKYVHEYGKAPGKTLPQIILSDLNSNGGKEAAFYCFILDQLQKGFLSRIHTHSLASHLEQVETVDLSQRITSMLRRYPMESDPPGLCIIFNMEEGRKGARADYENINNLFRNKFKYDVIYKINPTKLDVESTRVELTKGGYQFYDR